MLAKHYREVGRKPLDLDGLNCTKSIRNFLCDWLYEDDLLLSYLPNNEVGSATAYKWLVGGWRCEFDSKTSSIITKDRVNWRVMRDLFDAGLLEVRYKINPPNVRCIVFGWTPEIKKLQRPIVNRLIFNENFNITSALVDSLCAIYGIRLRYIPAKGLFELIHDDGEPIANGDAERTWILSNKDGNPVSRFKDMTFDEWENAIYQAGKRAKTLNKPLPVPEQYFGHLSKFKRNG
ncbi:hypothetical protein [Vibrio marisflavi]|uniref:Uncharacterized protein n=1 Tax=Vibrio marisflavi CECT 7928 TaxID=634439 RepID=A0ABN8EBD9_9VIBR|nr:hypothetical protein [Vibrio marisflavi]CAH0543152.1 hypothetical protein VMF7928_04426 [Vibrio marisflavi CECT 7928]